MVQRRTSVLAGVAAVLVAGQLAAPPAQAAPEDLPGRLVVYAATFAPGDPQTQAILTTSVTGGDRTTLLPLGAGQAFSGASQLEWSPDGSRIVFTGRTTSAALPDVWVMDADGSDAVRLTDGEGFEFAPTWSPDGSTIAFLSDARAPDVAFDVWTMDADGSNQHLLAEWTVADHSPDSLAWHPTDPVLLLGASRDVFTLDAAGGTPELLYASGGTDMGWPQWSPDGSRIAVTVEVTTTISQADVFLIDPADGSGVNLTNTLEMHESVGGWSPDGAALAWEEATLFFVQRGIFVHELATGTTTQVIAVDPDREAYSIRGWIAEPAADPDDVDTVVTAGQTVGTDPEGDGATPQDPVETAVTSPNAGTVTIDEAPVTSTPPADYAFFGQEVVLTAPAASAADPLVLAFRIDASVVPEGTVAGDVVVFRNGTALPPCTGAAGVADPDPCRASAATEPDGDLTLTVLTSAASRWNLGVGTVPADTTPPTVDLRAPDTGATYGRDQAVVVDYSCSDQGSGVTRCEGTRAAGTLLPTTALGQAVFHLDAEDAAGNTASVTATYRVVPRRAVVPTVTCVRRGSGGWWTARFGYTNRNSFRVSLPVGAANRFTTAPADRGQPTLLTPGSVPRAVEVAFRTTVTWRLDGASATARSSTRRC